MKTPTLFPETVVAKYRLDFAVMGGQGEIISLHQHPDAAARLIASSARSDLRVVKVKWM